MCILLIDDSPHIHNQLKVYLHGGGYTDLVFVHSAKEAFAWLKLDPPGKPSRKPDVILMDINMPEINGIEATRLIKATRAYRSTPIIMVSGDTSDESLNAAFEEGAVDYITKPIRKIELLARIRSALKLKKEIDIRKEREGEMFAMAEQLSEMNQQLQQANHKLERISWEDGLTNLSNRRYFDETLQKEMKLMHRRAEPICLIMLDVDHFKLYNDSYGHQAGDHCLKQVAAAIASLVRRPADFVARYGGEEFAMVLPSTNEEGGKIVGEKLLQKIASLKIEHNASESNRYVTVSAGLSCLVPGSGTTVSKLVSLADNALYEAKHSGRNCLKIHESKIEVIEKE